MKIGTIMIIIQQLMLEQQWIRIVYVNGVQWIALGYIRDYFGRIMDNNYNSRNEKHITWRYEKLQ